MYFETGDPNFTMRFAISALIVFLLSGSIFPKKDPWFAKDKALHFSVSFIAYNFAYLHTESEKRSLVFTISMGLAKEIIDLTLRKTGFSYKDLIYDIFGVLIAEST